MSRKIILFSISVLFCFVSFSQEKKNITFYDFSAKYGMVIESPRADSTLERENLTGFVFSYGVQTTGVNYWEEFFNYPKYGLRFSYTHYYEDFLGEGLSLYAFLQAPFYRTQKFSFDYSFGIGFGYHSKRFDATTNPANDYLSTHINANIDLSISLEYQIARQFDVFAGLNFSHFSNGATNMPNLGINGISTFLGLRYYDREKDVRLYHRDVEKPTFLKNEVYTFVAPSFMKYRPHGKKNFFGSTLEFGYRRQFHPCMKWGAGIDFFYAGYEKYHTGKEKYSEWNNLSQALFASYELMFGDVSLHVGLGVCTLYSGKPKGIIYERAGVFYNFGNNFKQFIGASIKAYGGVADYIEWTYGFKIKSW